MRSRSATIGGQAGRADAGSGYDWRMDVLVGLANLVVLLFIIESWVRGRIPAVLAKAMAERVDDRLNDPANPTNARLERLESLTNEIGTRLGGLERRMDSVDTRLEGLDGRLGGLDTRLEGLDQRVSDLDGRVAGFDARLDRVDAQVAVLNAQTSQQIGDLERRVRERLRGLERRERAPEAAAGGAAEDAS